jgi:formyltetrahydrofolate-dependent phosphoribosylglycinamide formyltransferase
VTQRIAVLISGNGSNLQALIDAVQRGELDAKIAVVISNRKAAYGLIRAEQAGLPTLYAPLKPFTDQGKSRAEYDLDLADKLTPYAVDWIVLAGWMHIFSADFLERFPNQVINLHPALPGAFPGTDAIERAFEAFQRGEVAGGGLMVHYVVPEVDAGEVIAQSPVPIQPNDTLDTFTERVHEYEHRLLVEAMKSVLKAESSKQ